jgi:multidrug transporter EmrE-like cation transporter
MTYVYLAVAKVGEVIATTALKATDQFRRPGPTAGDPSIHQAKVSTSGEKQAR